MGQATRTTKLLLDLGNRRQGGANTEKRAALDATREVLNQARAFYIDFFLAHADKLAEKVTYYSEEHLEMRERLISAHELLTRAGLDLDALPGQLQSLHGAAALGSRLAKPQSHAGLASARSRTAHSPNEEDRSQEGDGA